MARPRLTPLLKDTEVLGQENIDNTSLPTQQDPTKPLRLRPAEAPAPTMDIMSSPEVQDPFGENYAELDNNIRPERDLEAQLADEQGGSRWLNALGQFGNEVALGTVSGMGMLLDYENVGEGLTAGESDFGNWFSDAVDKVKEDLNKEMPTYRSEAAQTGWAPFDSTWWADNAATLGTTLSLMVPVAGTMRIPGAIGKFMRGAAAGSKVAKGVKSSNKAIRGLNKLLYGTETAGILEQGGSAVISRYLESTMEAHENFKGVEQELLDQGYSEEEAKAKAGEAARDVWQANWLNLAQDVFQYRTLSKGMSAASRASKEFRKGVLSQSGEFLKTMASEGAEEFGQYVIGEEATRAALDDKKSFFELGGLGTRLYDYIQEPEAKAAMLLGAAGGGMFHAISSTPEVYGRLSGTYDAKEAALAKQTALDQLDINTSYLVDGSTLLNQAIEYSANGKLNDLRDFYSSFAEMSDKELEAQGLSSEEIADKRKKDVQILEDIDFLGEEFSRVMDDSSRSDIVKLQEIASLYEKHKLSQSKGDINEKLNEETSKVLETDQISEQKLNVKRNGYKLNFYKVYREIFKKQSKDKEGFDKSLEQIDKNIELLEKQIASDKESLASSETETSDIPLTTRDSEIAALEEQLVINDLQNIGADRVLQNAHTEKGQKELLTEHEQREVDATLKKISPTSDIKFLKALANPNNKNPKGWDKIKAKLKGIADKAEVDLSPAIAGSESFEADLAKRYANTPLLFREMLQIQNKLTSEQDISEVKRIFTAEQFSNLYANNKNVAAAFDSLMSEKKSKYVKADLEGQIDPETTFVDPENPTDNTPTENPEGPVVYTPEGNPSKPGEAMIFSNAVVLYTYNAKTGVVKFSGLENHKEPMKLEDAIKLMDSLGYDSRFISSTKAAGAYRVLLTSDGQAIPSEFNSIKINGESVKLLSDEELKIINDPESKLLGGKIKFSVPRDADVNKDPNTTADNFLIVLSTEIEVDGEMKEVKLGTLGATKNGANNTDAVKRLRDTIFTEFKQSELQPAPTADSKQKPLLGDSQIPVKQEFFTQTLEDGGRIEYEVKTMLDGTTKWVITSFDKNGEKIAVDFTKIADDDIAIRDGLSVEDRIKIVLDEEFGETLEKTKEKTAEEVMGPKKTSRLSAEQREKLGLPTTAAPTQIDGISSEQYKSFVETGAVSQEIIDYLASKVVEGNPLTKEEQAIFTDKTAEVEKSIATTAPTTEAQKTDIERRREEELKNITADVNKSAEEKAKRPTPTQEEADTEIAEAKEENKELIAKIENSNLSDLSEEQYDLLENEMNDAIADKNLITWRIKDNKVIFITRTVKHGKTVNVNYNGSVADTLVGKFVVGDYLQVETSGRAIPATVTKISSTGRVLEAITKEGDVIIRNGVILQAEDIHKSRDINTKYDAELAALESQPTTEVKLETTDRVVFGHPTIGKSYLKDSGRNDFLSLDDDYSTEINKEVNAIAKKYKVTTSQVKDGGNEAWNKAYNIKMQELFNIAKARAVKENKTLFTSNTNLLKTNADAFDKVINLSDAAFQKRIAERGAKYDIKEWKQQINKTVATIPVNKVINTEGYLSDLLPKAPTTQAQPGIFTSSVDSVIIGDRTRGLFNSGWSKPSVPVHDALGDDFAMGVVTVDANGNVVFITKNIERHIDNPKKISNGNTSFYKNHRGNVVAYVKTAKNGMYIPVRLQTTKLDELPTEENAVHDIINELYDAYENGDLTPKPKSNTVKGVEIAEENEAVYAKIKEFNKKLLGYIPMRLAINTTIGGKLVLSTRRDTKGNNVLDTNPITREEALKYASGKTMRVDERKINTGNYNKELSEKGWIRVNLDIEAPMVASDVVAKIGSLPVAPQIKGVTDVTQPSQPPQPTAPPLSNEPIHPNDAAWEKLIASRKAAKEGKPAEKTTVKKEPSKKGVKTVTIAKDTNSNFNVDVNMKDGSVTFTESGNPLDSNKDARLINKAHLRSEYVSYEVFPYNNQRYAITSDDRIINITPDGKSIGAEVKWSGPVGKAIRKSQEETIPDEPQTIEVPEIGDAIDFTGVDSSIGKDENEDTDEGDPRDGGVVPGDDIFKWKEASDPEGSYEKWDEEKETAWFKENYPDVPFEVLKDLREIAGKGPNRYWGVFTNASVFIAQQAKTGTAYHEAFHAVFNLMLSDKERSQILKEGSRFAKGAINIEEHWADEFMEYQLSDGNTAHTLPEKVADFFKRLWHTIKIITERTGLTKAASMNDYMYRVSRGLYAKGLVKKFGGVNFKRDITRFSKQSENKSDYLNIREEEIGKRVMNAILINDILPAYRNLFKIPDASNGDVIKRVINEGMKRKDPSLSIEGLYKNVYQIIDTRKNKSRNLETKMLLGRFLDSIATKNEASGGLAMKPLFARAARALGHYGIKMSITLDTLSTTKDNLGEDMLLEENEELLENWMVKEKFISNKEKFSQKAKALFAQVPLRNEKFGSFTVYEQPSHVFNKLTSKLSSSRSLSDMMSKLDQLVKFNPAYKVIQDAFGDPTVATEFWKNMGQRSFTPFLSMTSGKGKSRTFVGNSQDASKDITERWAAEFRDSSIYDAKDSKVIPPKDFGKRVVQLEDLKNKVIKDVQDKPLEADGNVSREDALKLSNALKVIKMPIPHAEILEMFSDRDAGIENTTGGKDRFVKFTTALVNHMKTIERGADPFSGAIESNKYLTDIVETYLNVFPSLYQKTFKSGTNELIYSMLQSRFMQKMERELNNPNFQERKAFIENYMQDPFYRNSPFFKTLLEESVVGDKLNIAVFDALKTEDSNDGIEYSKLTPQQLEAVKINAFFNQQFDSVKDSTDYGYFMMPILSDSTSAAFMYFKKYTKEEAREGLVDSARQERDRIEWLDSRVNPVREEYNKWLADQFDRNVKHKDKAPLPAQLKDIPYSILKNGLKYQIFTDLNKDGIDLTGDNFEKEVMKMVNAAVKSEDDALLNEGILKRDKDNNLQDATGVIDERFLDPDVARENVNTYLYNTMLMNIQTLVTFGGDVAFYKSKDGNVDFTDVYKRIKEIWSPGDYLNADVSNTFTYTSDEKSETVTVSDTYGTMYITDPAVVDDVVSEHIEFIKEVHKDNPRKDEIVKEFEDLNETDAATIIDPIRAREIELGTRGLTNEKYEFYESLMQSGRPIEHIGSDHINVVYKPFQFFHDKATDVLGTTRMNPTQHKNAEFLVTPAMAVGNPKLEKAMEKFGYSFNKDGSWTYNPNNRITDSIMFTTAVKVGEVGSIDSIGNAVSDDVHFFANENYRIQMETPEHHIDTDVIEGVQYRKLIIENVDPAHEYTLPDGTPILGAQLIKEYNEAIYENVKEGYENLKKEFYNKETGLPDNEKIINALREQVIEQEKPEDMLRALDWLDVNKGMEIGPNGDLIEAGRETVLPLWHPDIVYQVESMMNSFFKKKIAKQKTEKGGGASLYNASSYGLSAENPKGYRKPKIVLNDEGGIDHFEAIMPVTMSALEDYADENGLIDITKIEGIDSNILKGIFYRIPTEHKYSMFHIKVIGFLPAGVGGQIILPEEATTIAGLDFDIDKLYGLLYNIEEYGEPLPEKEMEYQIWKNTPSYSPKAGKDIVRADIDNFDDTRGRREFAASQENVRWNKDDDQFTEKPTLRKIPSGMETKASRDNLKLDLATAVLSNKRTAEETLTPGGFKTIEETVDFILKLSGQTKGKLNPMLNSTGREVFNRNMTGLDLIGIFANHTANHALMTLGNVFFPIKKIKNADNTERTIDYGITFNGQTLRNLSQMQVKDANIMDLKQFLAAAVDNGKNPLASFLNLTTVTADTVATMVRVGFPIESVLMFSANPALKKMTTDLSKIGNTYKESQEEVLSLQMRELIDGIKDIMFPKNYKDSDFNKILSLLDSTELTYSKETKEGTLTDSIKKSNKTIEDLIKDKDTTELAIRYNALALYKKTNIINSEPLAQIMGQMRYDSSNNAAGPTIAHNKAKVLKHQKLADIKTIEGWDLLLANNSDNPARHVAAFYRHGIVDASRITGEVTDIPYASTENNIFNAGLDSFIANVLPSGRNLKPEDINQFYRAIETMLGTSYPTFKLKEMRRVIETLPSRLTSFANENPDSPYTTFLRHFNPQKSKVVDFKILRYNRNGVDAVQKQEMKNMLLEMLNDSNEEISALGHDLIKYAFATTGYIETPYKFTDLIPSDYTSALQEDGNVRYVEHLKKLYNKVFNLDIQKDANTINNVLDQIVRNRYRHLPLKYLDIESQNNTHFIKNNVLEILVPASMMSGSAPKSLLRYAKSAYEKNGKMTSVPMKFTGEITEENQMVFKEIPRAGADNEIIEMSYDDAVNNIPLISEIESYDYIPTEAEKNADFSKVPLNQVSATEALLAASELMPGLNFENIEKLSSANRDTHPFMIALNNLSLPQKQQLRDIVGEKSTMSNRLLNKLITLSNEKVPMPPAPEVSTGTTQSTATTSDTNITSPKNKFSITPIEGRPDKKATLKSKIATQYIGFAEGIKNSSTANYAEQAGEFANTGNYGPNDVIFVSIGGNRGTAQLQKSQQDRTIKEAIKAVEAGATIITDNKAYTDSNNYNTGEKRLYKNMEAKGYNYSEVTVDGQTLGTWSKSTQPTQQTGGVPKPVSTTFKDTFTVEEQQKIIENFALKYLKGDEAKALDYINDAFSKANDTTVKVISGGQTGVDQLGLTVATSLGIKTGGTAPKGFKTETGNDESLADFGLTESSSSGYPARTEDNVRNSDGTVYFALDTSSAGLLATKAFAEKHGKPFILNPNETTLREWVKTNNVATLNIAGNRASKIPSNRLKNIEVLLKNALKSSDSIINKLKECY